MLQGTPAGIIYFGWDTHEYMGVSMISDVHAYGLTPTILSAEVTQEYQHWSKRPDEADALTTIGFAVVVPMVSAMW